jgi:MFS superfamily sulfate permease-like transporter
VVGFQAPLSFLNAYHFRRDILTLVHGCASKPRLVVLEANGIVEIDFTAAQVLRDVIRACHADGIDLAIARLESIRAQQAVIKYGIVDLLGADHLQHSVEEAIETIDNGCRGI